MDILLNTLQANLQIVCGSQFNYHNQADGLYIHANHKQSSLIKSAILANDIRKKHYTYSPSH